ncbi:hypothetical protein TNCT_684181 [Trichonephila clavata]|uniref:Cyclin N-terminal domain-containing protein n=1 Tax=Trichonephila clavata TaxID=2740835 RepID=A0A8X6JZ25_TRICU|nr:hypothetical protein TNCT_684181 [Trichonephila clavata]
MSLKSTRYERSCRQPAILSRKRKAGKEIMISPSPEYSSPSSVSMTPSSCEETASSDVEVSGDENRSPNRKFFSSSLNSFRGVANMLGSQSFTCGRLSPLPELDWVEQKELWHSMVLKDMVYVRDSRMLQRHPDLEPRMRAILLDWLTEVSEVYRLHRETYYLAVDYVDRFLIAKPNLPRNNLQLLGATALFVASKMEEIYPPKLEQFSYVTDGACNDSQILAQELILIMTLNWNLSPISVIGWLSIFLQLAHLEDGENLIGPEKCPKQLVLEITRVLDLCILDTDSLKYPYSVLAASGIAHFISKETAMRVSGISWGELLPCVTWMKPFIEVACDNGPVQMIHFSDVAVEYRHNIQTHSASLRLLDRVHEKQRTTINEFSPSTVLRDLTPPHSHKKKKLIIHD